MLRFQLVARLQVGGDVGDVEDEWLGGIRRMIPPCGTASKKCNSPT
jgi:hypothetical protein